MLLRAGLIGRRCTASTLDLVRREPFKSALVVTTVKTVAADLIVQLAVQKQEWDPRRTALFGAFGFIYQGAAQYVVVNIVIERTVNALFPGMTQRVVAKCAVMNGLADPLLFLPTFYIFKETIHRANMPDLSTVRPRPLQQRACTCHSPPEPGPEPEPILPGVWRPREVPTELLSGHPKLLDGLDPRPHRDLRHDATGLQATVDELPLLRVCRAAVGDAWHHGGTPHPGRAHAQAEQCRVRGAAGAARAHATRSHLRQEGHRTDDGVSRARKWCVELLWAAASPALHCVEQVGLAAQVAKCLIYYCVAGSCGFH